MKSRILRLAISWLGFALAALLTTGRAAFAHAGLVSAEPPPGARLSAPPAEIRLRFSEALSPGSTFRLFGKGFRDVSGILPSIDPQAPEQMFAAAPHLEPDEYTVQWTAVTEDGAVTSGSYSFRLLAPESLNLGPAVWWVGGIGVVVIAVVGWLVRRRMKGG